MIKEYDKICNKFNITWLYIYDILRHEDDFIKLNEEDKREIIIIIYNTWLSLEYTGLENVIDIAISCISKLLDDNFDFINYIEENS